MGQGTLLNSQPLTSLKQVQRIYSVEAREGVLDFLTAAVELAMAAKITPAEAAEEILRVIESGREVQLVNRQPSPATYQRAMSAIATNAIPKDPGNPYINIWKTIYDASKGE